MGELIQIRVSAGFHDQDKALGRWPELAKLAFGPRLNSQCRDQNLLNTFIDALHDRERLGQLPKDLPGQITDDIVGLYSLKKKLDSFLADRNPQEADKISYQIEDLLDRMEESAD